MNILKFIQTNLKKKKLLAFLRIFGLIIGFTVALYIFEINSFEKSYDDFWDGADRMYRVGLNLSRNGEEVSNSAKNFRGSVHLFKEEIPGVEAACCFGKDVITVFCDQKQFNDVNWLWSDTTFFNVFPRKMISTGSPDLFADVHGVVISESFAKKLFGNEDPIHKKFKLNEGWEFYVNGVFEDLKESSHLSIDVVASYNSVIYYIRNFDNTTSTLKDNPNFKFRQVSPYEQGAWRAPVISRRPYCYLRLSENSSLESVKAQIPLAMSKVKLPADLKDSKLNFNFQPVKSIHLESDLENEIKANGSSSRVFFLYLIAIVVLIVCSINFLNLTTIMIMENGKQYAVRILNGAQQSSIVRLIIADNLIMSMVSGVFAIIITSLFLARNRMIVHPENAGIIMLIIVIVSLISALIPFYTSLKGKFQQYLKTQANTLPGTWNGRKSLVIFQFVVTVILIAGTIMINKQLAYMSNYRLGFDPQQTIFSYSPMSMNQRPDIPQRLQSFKNEVLNLPGVTEFAVSSSIPGKKFERSVDNVRLDKNAESLSTNFNVVSVTEGYVPLFGIELVTGSNLQNSTDWKSNNILINESAVKAMGFFSPSDAIGKFIGFSNSEKQIVGVIKDYHHLSLKSQIEPLILTQDLRWNHSVGYYALKFDAKRTKETLAAVSEIWETIYPGEVATFNFTDEHFAGQYDAERRFNNILSMGSVIALIVSCIGLFAIASFDTQKRIREIGIRKVNGARTSQILTLLNKDLAKWVLVSFVLAVPLAWYALQTWLENFAYRTDISWWVFGLAGLIILIITIVTVTMQSYKAASSNPVKALKYE